MRRDEEGSLVVPGGFPVHDLEDIGVYEIPDGAYATVAGLVLDRLARIPEQAGNRVTIGGWELEVTGVDRHAITEVRM